jgi:hypothetical protein
MKVQFDKGDRLGYFYNGNKLLGLWFAKRSDFDACDSDRLQLILANEQLRGRITSMDDELAVAGGTCKIKDGPPEIGGFVLMFPSSGES